MSGGTRCNITHATDNRGIVEAFGTQGRFLHSALAAFSVDQTIEFFEGEGVLTKIEETGKVFPVSNKAADVLQALLTRLEHSGAALAVEEPVRTVFRTGDFFAIETPRRKLETARLIVTTGGQSYPGSGTTGDGYAMARDFGHTIKPPRPALVPIRIVENWLADLRGITLSDVQVTLAEAAKKLAQRRGALLFAHFGLTGPVILDLSRHVSGHLTPTHLRLFLDFLPDLSESELETNLKDLSVTSARKQLGHVVAPGLPRRLVEMLLARAGFAADRRASCITRDERGRLLQFLKRFELSVQGTLGFGKAEVTAGGVELAEVDSRTMESKKQPGLYIAGELLDLDGPIGGYNFQAAFSTGWLAGASAGRASSGSSIVLPLVSD
ncbi:MAG TPA: NAD(P)/FAD-dependent oxidoreductase, partial [Gemmataceae bacterium]|nr:NAD(P)/FAD-dependent oxidoreductase [Gemmataceae bacterium]